MKKERVLDMQSLHWQMRALDDVTSNIDNALGNIMEDYATPYEISLLTAVTYVRLARLRLAEAMNHAKES